MTERSPMLARRYWFVDQDALRAINEAIDPPQWGRTNLSITIFARDDETANMLAEIVAEDDLIQLENMVDFEEILARESALYLQFAFYAIEDFGPALDLILEKLVEGSVSALNTNMLVTGQAQTVFAKLPGTGLLPEASWIATELLKSNRQPDPRETFQRTMSAAGEPIQLKLVAGTFFGDETGDDTDYWRAQSALAWNEVERLQTEKRVRQGREAAIKSRYESGLTNQAERYREEIGRLHRAAGWVGKWRARLGRLLPGNRG